MFQAGKLVEQIAAERGLSLSTIQGHLAHYVEENELDIHRLLSASQLEEIERYFRPITSFVFAKLMSNG